MRPNPDYPAIAYVNGGFMALGFSGAGFVGFFEVVLARADPRAFWVPFYAFCCVMAVIGLVLTVWSYARSISLRERQTFTYTYKALAASQNATDRFMGHMGVAWLGFFIAALLALMVDLLTDWTTVI